MLAKIDILKHNFKNAMKVLLQNDKYTYCPEISNRNKTGPRLLGMLQTMVHLVR